MAGKANWFLALGLLVSGSGSVWAQESETAAQTPLTVSTAQYNNSRTASNLREKILNQSNVNVNTFGKLFTWTVDGWILAQPLYIPNVQIGSATYNVVYIATMNNSVYAFDADHLSATPLWMKNFGPTAIATSTPGTCPTYGTGNMGILSTPVVDVATQTMYFINAGPAAAPATGYVFYINAIDIRTAAPVNGSPVLIQASVPGTGYDSVNGVVTFNSSTQGQRPALTLANGIVYAGFASCGPSVPPYHGWLMGWYETFLGAHTNPWNDTADGEEGGIWQSGRGFVTDAAGSVYLATGNGSTGYEMFASNIMMMNPWGGVLHWFTPGNWAQLDQYDLDLSSTGPLQIPGTTLLVAGGKQGVVYLMDEAQNLAVTQSFQATTTCQNGGNGPCYEMHDMAYLGNAKAGTLYEWGGKDNLRAFHFQNGAFTTTPTSQNAILSDYIGGTVSASSNGLQAGTGIVWATNGSGYPYDNPPITPTVYAYPANNVGKELWDSNQNAARDGVASSTSVSKWVAPLVVNGKVFVTTFDSYDSKYFSVYVYGLLGK